MQRLDLRFIAALMAALDGAAGAQYYPNKPLHFVTAGARGGTDFGLLIIDLKS